jgi:hypothetical protein
MEDIVLPQDHVAGFKDISVTFRSGRTETHRLKAPDYRRTQAISLDLQKNKDVLCVTKACLPQIEHVEKFLNSLTVASASLVENTAFGLTFGTEFQKKMIELGERLTQTVSTESEPKSVLSLAGFPLEKSVNIHCPNCQYIIALSGATKCSETYDAPTPAQLAG